MGYTPQLSILFYVDVYVATQNYLPVADSAETLDGKLESRFMSSRKKWKANKMQVFNDYANNILINENVTSNR